MWLDALALAILALFAGIGAWRGTLASAFRLLSLLGAYTAAVIAGPLLGPPLASAAGLPAVLGLPLGGLAAFGATYLLLGAVQLGLQAMQRNKYRPFTRSPADRIGGGAIGALRGSLIVLLVAWLASWASAVQAAGGGSNLGVGDSRVGALAMRVVGWAAEAAFGNEGPGGRMAGRLLSQPDRMLTK